MRGSSDQSRNENPMTVVRALARRGLSRREAYVLCTLAGDLKIFEIVDAGVWNVGFTIPLSIF